MDKYKFRTYLKHRRRSKGRHSIHSPFLYNLYNTCVVKSSIKNDTLAYSHNLKKRNARKAMFIKCFIDNSKINNVASLDEDSNYLLSFLDAKNINSSDDILKQISIINANNAVFDDDDELNVFIKNYGSTFIFIDGIFNDKKAELNWKTLIKSEDITLCVSFYHFGLISLNKDFTKQNFVLRF